jgi:dipeptidyl aminopeptidase/acylaminoacyl peptidase
VESCEPEYLGNWRTPQLIIPGERNRLVPISEARAAYNALRGRGIECSLLVLKGEGGSEGTEPEDVVLWYRAVLDWMERFTKG